MHALDADQNPSGSSSGSGTAAAAALSAVTIGTETSGSIISPSAAQGIVGLRPTVGLVSRYGIVPISASQDTAGPMVRTVADGAAELQAIAGADPLLLDPLGGVADRSRSVLPDYLAALDPNALAGKRIGDHQLGRSELPGSGGGDPGTRRGHGDDPDADLPARPRRS